MTEKNENAGTEENGEKNEKLKNYLKSNYIILPALALSVLLLSVASTFIDQSYFGYDGTFFLSVIIMQLVIVVIPTMFYIKLKGNNYISRLPFAFIEVKHIWLTVVSVLLLITGTALLRMLLGYAGYTESLLGDYYEIASDAMQNSGGVLYVMLAYVIVPSAFEELLYRGIIFTEYKEFGLGTAVVFSSVIWSMTRFNPTTFIVYLYEGIIIAIVLYMTKSLISSFIMHFCFNSMALFFEKYFIKIVTKNEYTTLLVFLVITAFLLSLFFFFAEAERIYHNSALRPYERKSNKEEDEKPEKPKKVEIIGEKLRLAGKAAASPTFILCVILFIFGFLTK